jgi:hypothetical protein
MPILLRSQSAVIHVVADFLNQINKKAIENGDSQDYSVATQWVIMGKTKKEIQDLVRMLGITIPFLASTINILAEELVERDKYE